MLQGEGLANNHHFKLMKEQFKMWGRSLGGAELMKKPIGATELLLLPHSQQFLCPLDAPGMLEHQQDASRAWLGSGTHGQALSRKRSGKLNTGPVRETGCAGVFRAAPRNAGWCRKRARAEAAQARGDTSHCSSFTIFPDQLQKQQSLSCTKLRQNRGSLSVGFPRQDPRGLP